MPSGGGSILHGVKDSLLHKIKEDPFSHESLKTRMRGGNERRSIPAIIAGGGHLFSQPDGCGGDKNAKTNNYKGGQLGILDIENNFCLLGNYGKTPGIDQMGTSFKGSLVEGGEEGQEL